MTLSCRSGTLTICKKRDESSGLPLVWSILLCYTQEYGGSRCFFEEAASPLDKLPVSCWVPALIFNTSLRYRFAILIGVLSVMGPMAGCHDGPLYALKAANPYYAWGDWKRDTELGLTDFQRREQLTDLVASIGSMPAERQQFWSDHLQAMIENDESPEMRRLAIQAAGNLNAIASIDLIEKGLDDDSVKVRMEACRALASAGSLNPQGKSQDAANVARMLASTLGTETNEDVRHAAMSALAQHKSPIAVNALRTALKNRNPATQTLAMESLRGATGKNYGDDPQVWIAALDGKTTGPSAETSPTRIADRVSDLLR